MPDLAEAIRHYGDTDWSPRELVMEYGGTGGLAAAISGVDDRKSRPYKSAQRAVERWLTGETKPSKARQKLLNEIGNTNFKPSPSGDVTLVLDGMIGVGSPDPKYQRKRKITMHISPDDWAELEGAAIEADEMGDNDILWESLGEIYGPGWVEMASGTFDIQ